MLQTLEPPYQMWSDLLKENLALRPALDKQLGRELRSVLRKEVLARANLYSSSLITLARDVAVHISAPINSISQIDLTPVIMSGHQPIVYHPGLMFKAEMLSRATRDVAGVGINIVVDTDVGDSGEIFWPKISDGVLEIKRGSLVEGGNDPTLYRDQRIAPGHVVADLFSEVAEDLSSSGLAAVCDRIKRVAALYLKLAGSNAMMAHTIVRWSSKDSGCLEVPLSKLIVDTTLGQVVRDLAGDAERFASIYNSSLDSYRREREIENKANPFPNVSITDEHIELPLWDIEGSVRSPVFVNREPGSLIARDTLLTPRGSVTTMLLRAYCSDLFIHGLGGARYDNFVDRFAKEYLGVELPGFAVASETRYLFPEQVVKTQRELELASQIKEMISRTENFLGRGVFSTEEESLLCEIVARRNHLKAKMQGASPPDERRVAALALNEENRRVRAIIETGSLQEIIKSAPRNEQALQRWKFREFPFFMFEWNF